MLLLFTSAFWEIATQYLVTLYSHLVLFPSKTFPYTIPSPLSIFIYPSHVTLIFPLKYEGLLSHITDQCGLLKLMQICDKNTNMMQEGKAIRQALEAHSASLLKINRPRGSAGEQSFEMSPIARKVISNGKSFKMLHSLNLFQRILQVPSSSAADKLSNVSKGICH